MVGNLVNIEGNKDILIGRDDGSVEVYALEGNDPSLRYNLNFQESVTGMGMGNVSWTDFKEIVISSFSGKVSGLIDSKSNEIDPLEMKEK